MITATKFPFTESQVDRAPDKQGVYVLYDGDTITYYGSSETSIRGRLKSHHRGDEGRCTQAATHFASETTTRPVAREKELLDEFKRIYGRLPRCNERVG